MVHATPTFPARDHRAWVDAVDQTIRRLRTNPDPASARDLVDALPPRQDPPFLHAVSTFVRHIESGDPLAAVEVLLGVVKPLLNAESPVTGPVSPDAPRLTSTLDPAGEVADQRAALPAHTPLFLAGAARTPLVETLAREPGPPIVLWESHPEGRQVAYRLAATAARTVTVWHPKARGAGEPSIHPWMHPALDPLERRDAWSAVAALRLGSTVPAATHRAVESLRIGVLHRGHPFYGEAEFAEALGKLGHVVEPISTDALTLDALRTHRWDLILCVNGTALVHDPEAAALVRASQTPLVLWFVDDPSGALGQREAFDPDGVLALAWERQAVARLRRWGFAARYLPHGAQEARPDRAKPQLGLTWVAASYRAADRCRLRAAAPQAATRLFPPLMESLRANRRLPLSVARAAMRDTELGQSALARSADARFVESVAGDLVAAADRRELALALRPLGIQIFGDDGWSGDALAVHAPIPYADRTEIYRASFLSLDRAHPQMVSAVTQRAFDVPGVGGVLLADDRPDLHEHFEVGREVLAFDSPGEAYEIARWHLEHPDARDRIARAGQARVLSEHTFEHRARTLLRFCGEHFGPLGRRQKKGADSR